MQLLRNYMVAEVETLASKVIFNTISNQYIPWRMLKKTQMTKSSCVLKLANVFKHSCCYQFCYCIV